MSAGRQVDAGVPGDAGGRQPTRRRAETRRRLLAAALETFAERGFYGSTVEDICERAGFTRGAFYSNFGSKEELFFALYAERTVRLIATIESAIQAGEEATRSVDADGDAVPDGVYEAAIERFLSVQSDDRRWYLVNTEFTLHAVRRPEAAQALVEYRAEVRARIAQLLVKGLSDAGRALTIDVDAFVRAALALHEGSLEQSYLEPEGAPPGHLERRVLPALLAAVTARQVPPQ
jgi:AcrR family transcriptional regulator